MHESPASAVSLAEATQFLYHEVRLLDERRFEEWMQLYTEDGCYWAPTLQGQQSPDDAVSLFYDDRATMAARVRRFAHPDIHVQMPLSRTVHIVSNIELDASSAQAAEARVHASFVMAEHRSGEPRWYAGRCEYRLVRQAAGLRMAMKKVMLVNSDAAFTAMAVYF